MECVGYDNAFQLELCDKFPLWVPPPRRPKDSGKSTPKKSKVSQAGHKRKREESPGSESENDDEREYDANTSRLGKFKHLSKDEDDLLTYTPRGTRSRPIYL